MLQKRNWQDPYHKQQSYTGNHIKLMHSKTLQLWKLGRGTHFELWRKRPQCQNMRLSSALLKLYRKSTGLTKSPAIKSYWTTDSTKHYKFESSSAYSVILKEKPNSTYWMAFMDQRLRLVCFGGLHLNITLPACSQTKLMLLLMS